MGKNLVRKTVQYNKTNPVDQEILKIIDQPNFNYNDFAKKAQLEYIRRQQAKVIRINNQGGIKHVLR